MESQKQQHKRVRLKPLIKVDFFISKQFQAPMYYRKANAAMLVFDITSEESFDDMKTWVNGEMYLLYTNTNTLNPRRGS